MADDNSGLMAEFEEFLNAKRQKEIDEADEDEEIEIWGPDGSGARVRRSRIKPSVLDALGIGADPEPEADPEKDKNPPKGRQSTGRQSQSNGVARKYFVSKPKQGK